MNVKDLTTLADIEAFLGGTQRVAFNVNGTKDEHYQWVEEVLKQHHYRRLGKRQRGLIRRFVQRITGYSRATVTRLISQYLQTGRIRRKHSTANGFQRRYTDADIRLLAKMDQLHHTPNGYAMKRLCERAYVKFGEEEYERRTHISVAHLYRLRASSIYRNRRLVVHPTRARHNAIGQRPAPSPNNQPGYLRVDSVHQGDLDKRKGLYHINAAQLKLLIEFTKSRPRKSNDNALVEGKNGSVVRKMFGHHHIPQHFAEPINDFNRHHLNPHLNFHRPCLYAVTTTDHRGRQKKPYPYALMDTPYEKLKSLPQAHSYLKPGVTFATLDQAAYAVSDNESAKRLNAAYQDLNQLMHGSGQQHH